jgi:hypothetical protein
MEYLINKISGRFRHLDEATLRQMRLELKCLLSSWGSVSGSFPHADPADPMPLWVEVEFLDNIVQFEMECNPFLKTEIC